LLVAGVDSHICVAQTALGALDAGFLVHVASDATSSRSSENWQAGLKRMERAGAVISSTEMMIYELLGQSGTWEFKTMLPLLK
jgi:nicotinamidase-related amidase